MNRLARSLAIVATLFGSVSTAAFAQSGPVPNTSRPNASPSGAPPTSTTPPSSAPSSTVPPSSAPPSNAVQPGTSPANNAPTPEPTPAHPPLPDYYRAGDPAGEEAAPPASQAPMQPSAPARYSPIFEPPPPPPPPVARHIAPRRSLWIGARAGMFSPFGFLWARASESRTGLLYLQGVPWQDYASTGPFLELDVGARLGRNYNVFGIWEHAFLPSGGLGERSEIAPSLGSTDFWAVGARINSDPDTVGVVAELAVGYRQFSANWDDGTSLELTQGAFESRVGLGAEIRLGPTASLTPMLTLAAGTFGRAEWTPDRSTGIAGEDVSVSDQQASHGSLTLQIAGHLDLLGVK